jgi:hypothetical protein
MKTSATLFYLSSLLSAALTLPSSMNPSARSPIGTEWSVYNYTEGCSPAAYVYGFNITWVLSPANEPYFAIYCTGNDIANELQSCEDPAMISYKIPGHQNVTLVVQHTYTMTDGAMYFVTGNITFADSDGMYPKSVGIKQSEARAIV